MWVNAVERLLNAIKIMLDQSDNLETFSYT